MESSTAGCKPDEKGTKRSDHCYRCGGMGHIANECPTPKGKGKGKEDRSFCANFTKSHEKGKGKSAGGWGHDKEKEKGERCALSLGSVAMTLRDAGRSILNRFLGGPPVMSKRTTTMSVIHADNNGTVCSVDFDLGWETVTQRC